MAATIGSIQILFDANYGPAVRGVRGFANETERAGKSTKRSLGNMDRSVTRINRTLSDMRGQGFRSLSLSALRANNSVDRLRGTMLATSALIGGLGLAFTVKGIVEYSDTWKKTSNLLRIVKKDGQELSEVQNDIYDAAQRSRAEYEATATLFSRLSISARKLNIEQKDVLRVTETIQKAFVVGGSTAQESAQSARQLSQGIASDRLGGDELRSVLENQALGQLLSDQITDGDIGKLRKLSEEGKLTAGVLIRAFKGASAEIDRLFDTTEQTIDQAFVKIDTALLKYIGTSDKVQSSTRATVVFLNALTENFDDVADSLVILAAAFGTIIGAKGLNGFGKAVARSTTNLLLYRQGASRATAETLALAKAEVSAARTPMLKSRLALNAALKNGNFTLKQVEKLQRTAAASVTTHRHAVQAASTANIAHVSTLKQLKIGATSATVAMRGLSSVTAFLGGSLGVALLATGGAMYLLGQNAQEAEERSDRYAEAIERAGDKSSGAAIGIREAAKELSNLVNQTSLADLQEALKTATSDADVLSNKLKEVFTGTGLFFVPGAYREFREEIGELGKALIAGNITIDEYYKKLNELSAKDDSMSAIIKSVREAAEEFIGTQGRIEGLQESIDTLDGTVANIEINTRITGAFEPLAADRIENAFKAKINKEFNRLKVMKKLRDDLGKQKKDLGYIKPKKAKKSDAEKEYERLDKALDRLDYRIAGSALPKLNKDTIEAARSAGVAEPKIRAFIQALKTDGEIPKELEQIRTRLAQISNIEFDKKFRDLQETNIVSFLSELDRNVVQTARSFGVAEEKIQGFISSASIGDFGNMAPKLAQIRGELESIAENQSYLDFADKAANLTGDLLNNLFEDGDTEDIFDDSLKSLTKLVYQLLVVEPLIKSIRAALGGLGISPSIATGPPTIITPPTTSAKVLHKGTDSGVNETRVVSASLFNNAPRFHNGLKSNELPAILEKGERVATKAQTAHEASVISRLTNAVNNNQPSINIGGGATTVNIHNYTGEKVEQKKSKGANGDIIDVMLGDAINRGTATKAALGNYGIKPRRLGS